MADSSASAVYPLDTIMKFLGTISDMVSALPATPANSGAMAKMYTSMFEMIGALIQRFPTLQTAQAVVRLAPSDLVRAAAATPLPQVAAEPAGPAAAPLGAEESEHEAEPAFKTKISLRQYGYRLSAKNATRFAALEKARAAHGSDTVAHRLELLKEIWQHHAHPRTAELLHNILCDLAYLREIDRREAEGAGSAAR